MYLCETELFEIELFICIKMDLALNDQQKLICHKAKQTNVMATVFCRIFTSLILLLLLSLLLLSSSSSSSSSMIDCNKIIIILNLFIPIYLVC